MEIYNVRKEIGVNGTTPPIPVLSKDAGKGRSYNGFSPKSAVRAFPISAVHFVLDFKSMTLKHVEVVLHFVKPCENKGLMIIVSNHLLFIE